MNRRQLFCVALLVLVGNLVCVSNAWAQYYFERDSSSYVRVDEYHSVTTAGEINGDGPFIDDDVAGTSTGDQSTIASSTNSAAASIPCADITAFSNTQISFNPDLVANGQVSALATSGVIASIGVTGEFVQSLLRSQTCTSNASCYAKFILRNSQSNPPSTAIKLKIKQSSSYVADPDFTWDPQHSFKIYKNSYGGTPMLTSSTAGEVTFIDPVANPGDSYVIVGDVNATGGIYTGRSTGSIIHFLGSLEVTGEAEVSVVP